MWLESTCVLDSRPCLIPGDVCTTFTNDHTSLSFLRLVLVPILARENRSCIVIPMAFLIRCVPPAGDAQVKSGRLEGYDWVLDGKENIIFLKCLITKRGVVMNQRWNPAIYSLPGVIFVCGRWTSGFCYEVFNSDISMMLKMERYNKIQTLVVDLWWCRHHSFKRFLELFQMPSFPICMGIHADFLHFPALRSAKSWQFLRGWHGEVLEEKRQVQRDQHGDLGVKKIRSKSMVSKRFVFLQNVLRCFKFELITLKWHCWKSDQDVSGISG